MSSPNIKRTSTVVPVGILEGVNWQDSFEIFPLGQKLRVDEAVEKMFGDAPPLWIRMLNGLRNALVRPFGIKPGQITTDDRQPGAFPTLEKTEDYVVLGYDDWHLNFRVVVQTHDRPAGQSVSLTTLVRRNNWFGYLYVFLITPFHDLIVSRLLRNLS